MPCLCHYHLNLCRAQPPTHEPATVYPPPLSVAPSSAIFVSPLTLHLALPVPLFIRSVARDLPLPPRELPRGLRSIGSQSHFDSLRCTLLTRNSLSSYAWTRYASPAD